MQPPWHVLDIKKGIARETAQVEGLEQLRESLWARATWVTRLVWGVIFVVLTTALMGVVYSQCSR